MTAITQPNGGNVDPGVTWHDPAHATLAQTKGWKGYPDAVRDYAQLETFVGAPADRLIKLPAADKIDDAFRSDVFKRIGYNPSRAPAKPEDYGVSFGDGYEEFSSEIAKLAHKHGIPKEALAEFAQLNTTFGTKAGEKAAADAAAAEATAKAEADKAWGDRNNAVNAKLKERFGPKFEEAHEYMTREALRLGFKDAAEFEAFERDLALAGGGERLERFRTLLADVAEMRKESPFHRGGNQAGLTQEQALAKLAQNRSDQAWIGKALTRGTPEAEENIRLNIIATGGTVDEGEVKRLASGLSAQAAA
jgi:hypothetical protein